MKRSLFQLFIALILPISLFAQNDSTSLKVDSIWKSFQIAEDDEVLRQIDMAGSAAYASIFYDYTHSNELEIDSIGAFEVFNDDTVAHRMMELDQITPFDLTYNRYVKAFINLYVNKKRKVTQKVLGLSPYYFPMFEAKLDQYNIPLELKYLAVVESALNPKARSRVGATGLWQFMYTTGKMYGFTMNLYLDDRMDPLLATDAACRYLSDLYKKYGDWNLVIAAYNCGPGNVNKAIRRSGGKRDFWEIRKYLPRETRGYVPAFHAVNYTMSFATEHGLTMTKPQFEIVPADTIMVCGALNFETLSKFLDVKEEWLNYFNPIYRYGVVPDVKKSLPLCLPVDKIGLFQTNEDSIYSLNTKVELAKEEAGIKKKEPTAGNHLIHRVRSGEVMGVIAQKYGVRVSQIKEWNNLWSSRIYPGQKLNIYTKSSVAVHKPTPVKKEAVKIVEHPGSFKYYTIQPGDTLWDIANKYKSVTVSDLKKWNRELNFKKLKPGDKIKISKTS